MLFKKLCKMQCKNAMQTAMKKMQCKNEMQITIPKCNVNVMRNDMQSDMQNNVQLYGVGDGCDSGEMGVVVLRDVGGCSGGEPVSCDARGWVVFGGVLCTV